MQCVFNKQKHIAYMFSMLQRYGHSHILQAYGNYFRRIPTNVITIHQRCRQTDRRHAIAIPRFALKCIAQ